MLWLAAICCWSPSSQASPPPAAICAGVIASVLPYALVMLSTIRARMRDRLLDDSGQILAPGDEVLVDRRVLADGPHVRARRKAADAGEDLARGRREWRCEQGGLDGRPSGLRPRADAADEQE